MALNLVLTYLKRTRHVQDTYLKLSRKIQQALKMIFFKLFPKYLSKRGSRVIRNFFLVNVILSLAVAVELIFCYKMNKKNWYLNVVLVNIE